MAVEEIKNPKLEQAKKELDSLLANNPSFDDVFLKELRYLSYKTQDDNIEMKISDDKKSVSLTTFSPIVDYSIPDFKGSNESYINSKIYLKDDNMILETSQGVLFDRKELEKSGYTTYAVYESKLETLYSYYCYDKYGFEYSNSSYSDTYPINKPMEELNAMEQTNSSFHKPEFYEYMLPKHPIHMLGASVRNVYRKKGSYAVIHANVAKITTRGYENVNCALYTTHYLTPKLLRGEKKIAKSVEHEGRYIFIIDKKYAESVEEGYNKAREELKNELEKNKNDYDNDTYNYIIENI